MNKNYIPGRHFLQLPGPSNIPDRVLRAMDYPTIDHRGPEFSELALECFNGIKQVFKTKNNVIIYPASGTGAWEAALVNCLKENDLVLMVETGHFASLWEKMANKIGIKTEILQTDWRRGVDPNLIEERLLQDKENKIKAVCIVHNETSTGVMNPLEEIAKLKEKYPDVMFIVDSVSSMTAVPINFDQLGIDVLLAGTQKAWALPPGLSTFVASEAALERSAKSPARGYYFDFHEFQKNAEKNMTPSTPSIPHINGMSLKLDEFFTEGLEKRYERHQKTNQMTRNWASKHGFTLFPENGYESISLTCLNNGAKEGGNVVDVPKLQGLMKEKGILIDGGYGKLKGKAFRLSNMGDETEETMGDLFNKLDISMEELNQA
mgnify:CR=1 FL=1